MVGGALQFLHILRDAQKHKTCKRLLRCTTGACARCSSSFGTARRAAHHLRASSAFVPTASAGFVSHTTSSAAQRAQGKSSAPTAGPTIVSSATRPSAKTRAASCASARSMAGLVAAALPLESKTKIKSTNPFKKNAGAYDAHDRAAHAPSVAPTLAVRPVQSAQRLVRAATWNSAPMPRLPELALPQSLDCLRHLHAALVLLRRMYLLALLLRARTLHPVLMSVWV